MKKTSILLASILAFSLTGCGLFNSRSMEQVSSMTYKPKNGDKTEWEFEYTKDGYLENIEKSVDGKRISDQEITWDKVHDLEKINLVFKDSNLGNFALNYAWKTEGLDSIKSKIKFKKSKVTNEELEQKGELTLEFTLDYKSQLLIKTTETSTKTLDYFKIGSDKKIAKDTETKDKKCRKKYNEDNIIKSNICDIDNTIKTKLTSGKAIYDSSETGDEVSKYKIKDNFLTELEITTSTKTKKETKGKKEENQKNETFINKYKYDDDSKKLKRISVSFESKDKTTDTDYNFSYDKDGRIVEIKDDAGNTLEIEYNDKKSKGLPLSFPEILEINGLDYFDLNGDIHINNSKQNEIIQIF